MKAMALEDPSVPSHNESGRWYDKHGNLLLAYFAGNHGMPKKVLERKHWHTQMIFHLQDKGNAAPRPQDNRHLHDVDNPLFYYYKKGEAEPYAEPKSLRHDLELRFEQGHKHDVSIKYLFM